MNERRDFLAVLSMLPLAATAVSLDAFQSGRSTLRGSVLDEEGGEMPGVSVSIRGHDTRSTTTDVKGQFGFANMPHGDYELRAALEGFPTVVQQVSLTDKTTPVVIRMRLPQTPEIVLIDR